MRSELQGKWRGLCLTGHIEPDPEDPRTAHLSAPPCPPPLTPPYVPVPLGEDLQAPVARLVGGVRGVARVVAPALVLNLLLWGYRSPRAHHCPLLADTEQREGTVAPLSPGELTFHSHTFYLLVQQSVAMFQHRLFGGFRPVTLPTMYRYLALCRAWS